MTADELHKLRNLLTVVLGAIESDNKKLARLTVYQISEEFSPLGQLRSFLLLKAEPSP